LLLPNSCAAISAFSSGSGAGENSFDEEIGGWRAKLTLDQIDNAYDKLSLGLRQVWSIGNNTLFAKLDFDTDLGSGIPYHEQFRLGGFFNLSGLKKDQLQGNVVGLASLGYYRKIAELPSLLDGGVYFGGALELGNAWQDIGEAEFGDLQGAGLVFVGAGTILGPAYLGYARTEGGQDTFYLSLGRVFQ
jgi:NTE family protein